jgi:UDP-N-acetylmuramoyl-tripeptide--D-alanyl-D-alanine ligase
VRGVSDPLWTSPEIETATGGRASASFDITGLTFDSREVAPGWLFVAMPGTVADGHDFVAGAFAAGAAGALVSRPVDGPHVLVPDVPAALTALAIAARKRISGKVLGVTGSVGKTSTKEALAAALERRHRGKVHRSLKSYNNHTGVPLSVARMPRDSVFGVFEMGMNNPGEIRALTALVRPHVVLITALAPAHIENLGSMEAIADAKSEIAEGLEPGGVAIVPYDTPYRERLVEAVQRHATRVITFGSGDADVIAVHAVRANNGGSLVTARLIDSQLTYTIAQPGAHWVSNSDMGGLKGRGERHQVRVDGGQALLIDESYNANPASMAATLKNLAAETGGGRRIAVLGTMLELGNHSDREHAALAPHVLDSRVDELILVGEATRPLEQAVADKLPVRRVADAAEATEALIGTLRPGDSVLVKASNGVGLAKLVERVAGGGA